MSFLAEIKSTTEAVAAEKARQEQAALEAEVVRLNQRQTRELERYSLEGLKEEIRKAASEGRTRASISVFSYEDQTPSWWEPVKEKLTTLASTLEVAVDFDVSSLASSGSDPLFDHTTYYGRAYFSW
ncbi:hypothetical protein [Rhizobium sp. MHM7A]|uniref:hypothetical protein n=1 Tax=Rhizobium sp. MHM7A TaxID=2583233 RepID=UPI001105A043|nr:hypothetical protein [Rhizobium sp. MHM7A]TLX17202.1 hypothetical protein FFR93_07785 [Rhizobium sp. MHM7A]